MKKPCLTVPEASKTVLWAKSCKQICSAIASNLDKSYLSRTESEAIAPHPTLVVLCLKPIHETVQGYYAEVLVGSATQGIP